MTATVPVQRLKGVTVLWTGSPNAAEGLLGALEAEGAVVERHSLLSFGPPGDPVAAREKLGNLDGYDWLLFTSAQAARAVRGLSRPSARIGVVGAGTAEKLEEQGWQVDLIPAQQNAGALADEVALADRGHRRVLFLRGDKALRILPERLQSAGFFVDEVEVYSTHLSDQLLILEIVKKIEDIAHLVIVGSPAGVGVLRRAVGGASLDSIKPGLLWGCLGQTTAKALCDAGVESVVCPEKIDAPSFVEAVAFALDR